MGKWRPAPIADGAFSDDSAPWSAQDLCGWIPRPAEQQGTRSAMQLAPLPGLQEFAFVPDTRKQRGGYVAEGRLILVADQTLYQQMPNGSLRTIGTIPGTSRCSFAHNGVSEVIIVNGSSGYIWNWDDDSLTQITDAGFPGGLLAAYNANAFLVIDPTRRYFQNSALNDGLNWNALETYQGESKPDKIKGHIVFNGEYVLFQERSFDRFSYTGVTNALYERIPGTTYDRGCAATHAINAVDNAICFIGDDGSAYMMRSYTPERISTGPIEQAWSNCDLSKAYSFVWEDKGHKVWYVTFPDGHTWGYDFWTQKWHRRQSEGMTRWRLAWLVKWRDHWYGGEYNSGRVMRLDWAYQLEGSDRILRRRISGVAHDNQNRLTFNALEVVVDASGEATTATSALSLVFDTEQQTVGTLTIGGALPDGAVGDAVNFQYRTIGGTGPITFSVSAGALPAGLTLNATTGALTGTYTTAEHDNAWTMTATDADGNTATLAEAQYVLDLLGDPPDGIIGDAYSYSLTGTEGTSPYTFALTTGTLPDGLSLASGGAITGTPTTAQTKAFSVTMTDAAGVDTVKAYSVTIEVSYGDIYIGLSGSGSTDALALIDGNANTLTGTYAAGDEGSNPVISADEARVYFHGTNHLSYLTRSGGARSEFTSSGVAGAGIVANATHAYVLAFSPRLLEKVTLADGTVTTYSPTTECGGMCWNAAKTKIYLGFYTTSGFSTFDLGTPGFTDTAITARNRCRGVALNPITGRVYSTCRSTVDDTPYLVLWNPADGLAADAVTLSEVGGAIAVTPDGEQVWVVNYGATSGKVFVYDTATHTLQQTITVGNTPNAIVMNAAGTRAYVCNGGDNTVSVINVADYSTVATVTTPAPPFGAAILE
jgi:YVTN family beta-propeller protein